MISLRVRAVDGKHVRVSGINPLVADCLFALSEILEKRDSPAARPRLFPNPTAADEKGNADWQRLIAPELRHLFVSAGETVTRDLTQLERDPDNPALSRLTFAVEHTNAWMSALNQARLILGEMFKLTEEDLEHADFDLTDPKQTAILRVHILGYLLQLFVELESGYGAKDRL